MQIENVVVFYSRVLYTHSDCDFFLITEEQRWSVQLNLLLEIVNHSFHGFLEDNNLYKSPYAVSIHDFCHKH